ncbi:MAG: methionine biosynthesis protein MetW [Acidobacteriota bacterium]
MRRVTEINLSDVMKQIHEEAERRRREDPEFAAAATELRPAPRNLDSTLPTGVADFGPELANIALAAETLVPGTRFARFKRLILRLIKPYTVPQMQFNRAVTRALAEVAQEQNRIVDLIDDFNRFLFERDREAAQRAYVGRTSAGVEGTARTPAAQDETRLGKPAAPPFDYVRFQDKVRGAPGKIRGSMLKYVQHFEHTEPVLDLGCGRGEFLELLREAGVEARGVDGDPRMVAECRQKGLDVVEGDLVRHLEQIEPESLGGIVLTQVVEHLDLPACLHLLTLACLRLRTGGVLLVETPNPASLFTHACSLHLDPTHVRAYHPVFLEFLFQELGLGSVEVLYSNPPEESWLLPRAGAGSPLQNLNEAFDGLNRLLYGSQDYAVIGRK